MGRRLCLDAGTLLPGRRERIVQRGVQRLHRDGLHQVGPETRFLAPAQIGVHAIAGERDPLDRVPTVSRIVGPPR